MTDNRKTRYCTMPAVPWFRDWFEDKFGHLCKAHDKSYEVGECKLCADLRFTLSQAVMGYLWLAVGTLLAFQLPWVWLEYFYNKWRK